MRAMTTILLLAMTGATAAPIEECKDCTYQDLVTGKRIATSTGVSEDARPYMIEDEDGWRIRDEFRDKFFVAHPMVAEDLSDSGDPAYDDDDEPWWLFLLKLILAAAQYVEDLEMNGGYDGYITVDGVQVPAYLELQHFGSDVRGSVAVLQPFTIDAGVCPSAEVPAGTAFDVRATEVAATTGFVHRAVGSTTRRVGHVLFWDIDATVSFDLSLANDLETLVGSLDLVVTDPCADAHYTGVFHRRPVF